MAGLERDLLEAFRLEYRQLVGLDDAVAGDGVLEGSVRQLDEDAVALAQSGDVSERGAVRRPVARDVDELALTGHLRAEVSARPALERVGVGAVDHDLGEAEARDAQPCDRVATFYLPPPEGRVATQALADLGRGCRSNHLGPIVPLQLLLEAPREAALIAAVEHRGEGVLPLPDRDRPREHEHACGDHQGAQNSDEPLHRPSCASCVAAVVRRTTRSGGRGPRARALEYGAYRPAVSAVSCAAAAHQTTARITAIQGT